MVDEIKSNLEPIEEGDLDLKKKFSEEKPVSGGEEEARIESIHPDREKVERQEGSAEKEAAYARIISKVGLQKTPVAVSDEDVSSDAAAVSAGMDAENKVSNLVNLAETKGIVHAVKVARHMEDNYALDEFHDKLLGEELHDALVKRGMIREI